MTEKQRALISQQWLEEIQNRVSSISQQKQTQILHGQATYHFAIVAVVGDQQA